MTPEQFLTFADPLPEPMLLLTSSGRVLAVNRAVELRLGLPLHAVPGKSLTDLVADSADETAQYLRSCARSRSLVVGSLRVLGARGETLVCRTEGTLLQPRAEGTEAILLLRLTPKESAVGQFVLLNQRIEDLGKEIRRRRQAEAEARQQADKLRVTLHSIGDGVIVTDAEGRVELLNPVAAGLTGWTLEEAEGQPLAGVFRIVNEQTREPVENPALRALQEGIIVGLANHTVLIAKDGTERPIADSAAPIRRTDGEIAGCVLVFRDVSESHRQAAALREQERQFGTLAESIPQLAWMANASGHVLWYNRRWYEYTGTTLQYMQGRGGWAVHEPNALPKLLEQWKECVRTGTRFDKTLLLKGRDGQFRPFLTRVEPVRDEHGHVVRWFGTSTDVSAQQEVEDELRRAKDDLQRRDSFTRDILGSISDGFYALDKDWRFTYVNDEVMERSGLERDDILGRRIWELFPASVGTAAYPHLHQSMADRSMVEYEMYYEPWKQWFSSKAFPTGDGGLAVYSRDVTERKLNDQRLRNSEERFRSLVTATTQIVWTTDATGAAVEDSPTWRAFTGQSFEEWRGWGWADAIHPDDRAVTKAAWQRAVATTTLATAEFRLRRHDGEYRWMIVSGVPIMDDSGGVREWICANTDISEQKRAEEALRGSEERYRSATAAVSDVMWTNSAEGLMDGEQPGWRAFTGQSSEEYKGYGWSAAVHPDDAQPTLDAWARAVAEKRMFVFEHRVRRHDGEWRDCTIRAVPIITADGLIREWVGVHADITERKRDDEALQNLTAQLSEADRRKDEFLATLAHELRNPLAPIRTGLEVLKLMAGPEAALEPTRSMIDRQVTQMVRLVDDLMDVSRISRGQLELRKERVPLATVLQSALESSRPLIEQMGHRLTVTLPTEPLMVDADMTRLPQVFLNLLNNAAKYGERGGHIQLSVEPDGSDVVVRVTDTGIGMAADQLHRIFEMFGQGDRSLEKSQGGLGIGLTLARRLAEMHGGSVEAHSEGLGMGSEFVVRLPVVVEGPTPHTSPEEEDQAAPSSLRILIVDDGHDGADSLAVILQTMGNDTRTAYDGEQGLDEARTFRPDVILCDIGLPKLNGLDVCRRIRAQSWGKSVMLVALTGWGQDADRRRSHEAGFDHHLVKPVELKALVNLLAGVQVAKR